jgi:hypothetical protein
MMKATYDLNIDPSRDLYSSLLGFALDICPLALLVVRPEMDLMESGQRVLDSLEPYIESKVKSTQWPGTEIFDAEADLLYFRLEGSSVTVLQSATDHLFGWCQPDLPEDLCLFRRDRTPWLVTIAHERDGYFLLSEWERRQLLRALPSLRLQRSNA